MEREWVVEVLEEEPVAGESCGLERKRRVGIATGKETPATEVGDATATVSAGGGEERQSVYFDGVRGNGFGSVVSELKSTESDHYISENLQNGNADNLQNVGGVEENLHANQSQVENGSFHVGSSKFGKDKISESKVERDGQNESVNDLEIDLEKVLEEQETHDLFCPNCHSCITKRVILRRRKRKTHGFDRDLRPEKVQHVEPHVADIAETTRDIEPDVFRCLSCFSFFIPTENGFNIFRTFGKKDESGNLLHPSIKQSGQASESDANWFISIFRPKTRRKRSDEAASETADTIRYVKGKDNCEVTTGNAKGKDNYEEDDIIKPLLIFEQPSSPEDEVSPNKAEIVDVLATSTTIVIPHGDAQINVDDRGLLETRQDNRWEVLKSIVYGGLVESITSLGVVSSAAGSETSTLNIIALGLANLVGGFFVILHDLLELKNSSRGNQEEDQTNRYWKVLGRRSNFGLHATVAIFSYIISGFLPPVIYGFSFRESDNKEYKLIAVAAASLLCISLLAIAKAHVSQPSSYAKTLFYHLGLGVSASGISYVAGLMIDRLLKQFDMFSPPPPSPSLQLAFHRSSW